VQSFVDQEAQSVGRLHKRATVLEEIARLRDAGLANISIDLIAACRTKRRRVGLLRVRDIATGVPHASVYMLEVDDDSRLGRELIAGAPATMLTLFPTTMPPPISISKRARCSKPPYGTVRNFNFARVAPHSQNKRVSRPSSAWAGPLRNESATT